MKTSEAPVVVIETAVFCLEVSFDIIKRKDHERQHIRNSARDRDLLTAARSRNKNEKSQGTETCASDVGVGVK